MRKITSGKQLRFPVLRNIEYISIYQNRNSVLEIEGSEVEGKTWRELQFYLGEKLPINSYHFSLKQKNDPAIHTGKIRSVAIGKQAIAEGENQSSNEILKEFKTIKEQLAKATSGGGVSFEMLLASTKQAYEAQVGFKDQIIMQRDQTISELKKDIDELEDELNDCSKQLQSSTGIAQYIEIGQKLLNARFGGGKQVTLKESNTSDIPKEILYVIGAVDWNNPQITPEIVEKIANGIKQYISLLPLKGN